jgi:hypothetical protein
VVNAAQLLDSKTSAARAAAGPSKQEQEPLVPRLAPAALLAFQDSMISELVDKGPPNTHQGAPATCTLSRGSLYIENCQEMASRGKIKEALSDQRSAIRKTYPMKGVAESLKADR